MTKIELINNMDLLGNEMRDFHKELDCFTKEKIDNDSIEDLLNEINKLNNSFSGLYDALGEIGGLDLSKYIVDEE